MIIYHFTFDHHFLDRAGLSSLSSHWSVTGPDPGGDGNFSATRLVFSPPPVIAAQVENHPLFIFTISGIGVCLCVCLCVRHHFKDTLLRHITSAVLAYI